MLTASPALAAAVLAPGAAPAARAPVRVDEPAPGKATVVFYRKWSYAAGGLSFIVREGTAELGRLSPGSYFVATVEPGLHTYTVHSERHDNMQLQVDAGEIYYVRFELEIGVLLYQPSLTPAQEWQFIQESPKLHLSKPLAGAAATNAAAPAANAAAP
ncbi:MAG: DUF2846 domain-containing protein [Caulobacterales bacterium]